MQVETGGIEHCDHIKGQSGEVSCLQYMPTTWTMFSEIVLGYEPNPTKVNALYVTAAIFEKWMDEGLTPYQIALRYNGGEVKEKKGVNKYGVKYDSGAYAQKVVATLAKLN